MKNQFKFWLSTFLITLFIASCSSSEEDVTDLQVNSPESILSGQTQVGLTGVDLSLRVSSLVTGDLIIRVKEEGTSFPVYTINVPASSIAGNGVDYVNHRFNFSGSGPVLYQGKTYELSVARSIDGSVTDFIYWESSSSVDDPIQNYTTDHGANDYVFALYNFFSLASEQPYGNGGYELGKEAKWQLFPNIFTSLNINNRLDLYLENKNQSATGQAFIEIRDMSSNVIASKTINVSDLPEFVNIDGPAVIYFDSPLDLVSGNKYIIAIRRSNVSSLTDQIVWKSCQPLNNPNSYPYGDSGNIPFPTIIDFSFRTYFNGTIDQSNLLNEYGYAIVHNIWYTQEFLVGAP